MSQEIVIALISGVFTLLASLLPVLLQRRSQSKRIPPVEPASDQPQPVPPPHTAIRPEPRALNRAAYFCLGLAILTLMLTETTLGGGFTLLLAAVCGFLGFSALRQPGARVPTWVGLVLAALAAWSSLDILSFNAATPYYFGF